MRILLDDGLHADPEAQIAALGRLADGHGFSDAPMYEEGELDFERYARLIGVKHPDKRKPEEAA